MFLASSKVSQSTIKDHEIYYNVLMDNIQGEGPGL